MLSIPTTPLEHCMFVICGHTKRYLPRPDGSLIIAVKPQAIEELRTVSVFLFCIM
jgi:exonuclease I